MADGFLIGAIVGAIIGAIIGLIIAMTKTFRLQKYLKVTFGVEKGMGYEQFVEKLKKPNDEVSKDKKVLSFWNLFFEGKSTKIRVAFINGVAKKITFSQKKSG